MKDKIDVHAVLDFWFGDSLTSMDEFARRNKIWFSQSDSFDEEVRSRFEPYPEWAGHRENVHLEDDPKGILGLIIVLDQFPRNMYRGTPRAFAYDAEALRLSRKVIDNEMQEKLVFAERLFAFMPLQHSEDLAVQEQSVEMCESLHGVALNAVQIEVAEEAVEFAILHKEIIERFGRFPHRNEILGRKSSAEELQYLADGAETFGQVKKEG